jgi:erythronate-4-phosphate dehydrogenase
MLKIIVDENVAYAKEAFSSLGEVRLLPGREITSKKVKDADALIVRSVTKVNEGLLRDSKIKFVGTATIGTDHVDKEYLKSNDIYFTDAAGCNADAVTEFVFTLLTKIICEQNLSFHDLTIGIVGVGNVGSRIARLSETLGMNVLKNDPPIHRKTGGIDFVDLNEVLKADIITLHVPLNIEGIDKTYNLFDEKIQKRLKDKVILINSCRGPVVNNAVLEKMIIQKQFNAVLDVWENEPNINLSLLRKVKYGTPHIAGYSFEGKVNGTTMVYNKLCKFLKEETKWKPALPEVKDSVIKLDEMLSKEQTLNNIFSSIYNIERDDSNLRKLFATEEDERGKYFDNLRKTYPLRREFTNYTIKMNARDSKLEEILKAFRFTVISS